MRESHGLEMGVRPPAARPQAGAAHGRRALARVGLAARTAASASRATPTPASASAALGRSLGAVDGRIVALMMAAESAEQRGAARLELALLARLHRTLAAQGAQLAHDVVLCDSVVEYADNVAQIVADLTAGGAGRLRRLMEHNRSLLTELAALGGAVEALRSSYRDTQAALAAAAATAAAPDDQRLALALFAQLSEALERACPRGRLSWLEDVTRL